MLSRSSNFGLWSACCSRTFQPARLQSTSLRHKEGLSEAETFTKGNIAHVFCERMRFFGDKTAITLHDGSQSFTYNELLKYTRTFCSFLVESGFKRGDVLAIYSPNQVTYPVVHFGAVAAGGIVTTVNPTYTVPELVYQLKDSGATRIATISSLLPIAKEAALQCGIVNIILMDSSTGKHSDCLQLSSILRGSDRYFPETVESNSSGEVTGLFYTSGTTGFPKGAMLTHSNILSVLLQAKQVMSEQDRSTIYLTPLPFYHIYGMVVLLQILYNGNKAIIIPKFDPMAFLKTIENHKVTAVSIVPPIARLLVNAPNMGVSLESVKCIGCGGAPISIPMILACQAAIPELFSFRQGYGLTETTAFSTWQRVHLSPVGSVGKPVWNSEVKIVSPDDRSKVLGSNQTGEVALRGPQNMAGYWRNPEATRDCIDSEGWFYSGDMGYCDENNELFIVDRIKELIKVKGLQVAPAELEAVLLTHPGVADVAVIGVPDELRGELPRAYIVRKAAVSATELQTFLEAKVSPHKLLKGGVEFVDAIPRNPSGKILRRLLKTSYMESKFRQ